MNVIKKMKTSLIFFIKDDKNFVWGVAPSKIQARRQIRWFLPRGLNLYIEPQVVFNKY
jgi:hypothetical protein